MADPTIDELHMVEVALRDLSNIPVIRAMDRLVALPRTQADLRATMDDLELVKQFVAKAIPDSLREPAAQMFTQHVNHVLRHFDSRNGNPSA